MLINYVLRRTLLWINCYGLVRTWFLFSAVCCSGNLCLGLIRYCLLFCVVRYSNMLVFVNSVDYFCSVVLILGIRCFMV